MKVDLLNSTMYLSIVYSLKQNVMKIDILMRYLMLVLHLM